MKKITLLALLFGGAALPAATAQTVKSVAAARADGAGATVTVRGVVTNGPELGVIRYLQDGTAGLAAYSTSAAGFSALAPGDSIEISGTLKNFNGLLEIDPVSSVTLLAQNRVIRPAATVDASAITSVFAEQYESRVVRINKNTSVTTSTGGAVSTFGGNTNYLLNGQTGAVVRTAASANVGNDIVGKQAPSGQFDLLGIMSQFASNGVGGYQLLPRRYQDFILGGTPNFLSSPYPTNISNTGFTVHFATENAGTAKVEYSTALAGPFTTVTGATTAATQHSIALTGLQPGTIYYVKASSTNAIGTSESRVVPMATASLSSGKMRAYFTGSVNTSVALPGNGATYLANGAIADTVARYISKATKTLDIAIYNWNSVTILNAVNAAHARGVQVRVLFEDDNTNASVSGLNSAIPRIGRQTQQNIMHNKFVVIDAEDSNPNVPWVWTGSTNWTPAQLNQDRNNAIAIQDQVLARTYTLEFNEMWGGGTTATARFGSAKTDNTPHYFLIGGKSVESWFSPTDQVNTRLIQAIQSADNDLHIATMLITRTDLSRTIVDQVRARNIAACSEVLLNDTTNAGTGAILRTIRTALGDRAIVKNTSGIMHHKYAIVDAGASQSDPQVFVGSHNWSLSADTENDENTLIVHDARVVNQYFQEFSARIAEQNRGFQVCNLVLSNKKTVAQSAVQVYPNPTSGKFQLRVPASAARTAHIILRDATGRVVLNQTKALNGQEISVDASSLRAGLYLVQIETPESTQVSRVVVE
ncbi:phosphatidylserine/phosphatidylglycerophosphate/cardiolipin synthase-like enzyme [Hymenobacter luteus]|uniref:phospholipase D n=2 Tax=Hymenobacter TaxID=89966 RepID=A0A7W9T369_9BACT|nr:MULTISPECIES: phospholipase D-like domain-containing protein [Hymenobacter]MBB4601603.1 phosphatidylserine/phosphatidylglycerophosphate/cardiolipin synthase-like enzyme [Hymenobacter latericoloratus]MBB6059969.1 phosphatidylserine/phosphatidylglycerophosphate/cardiolipin synthase-like enzyme [Hymenobacter luteus]